LVSVVKSKTIQPSAIDGFRLGKRVIARNKLDSTKSPFSSVLFLSREDPKNLY